MRATSVLILQTVLFAALSASCSPFEGSAETSPASASLLNGDFESGCDGWTVEYGTLSASTDAHAGSGACRACSASSTDTLRVYAVAKIDVVPNATYGGELWYRAAPDAPPTGKVVAWLVSFVDDTFHEGMPPSDGDVPGAAWKRVGALGRPKDAANGLQLDFALPVKAAGECVLLDDARVYRKD